jgi:hypothetical protein
MASSFSPLGNRRCLEANLFLFQSSNVRGWRTALVSEQIALVVNKLTLLISTALLQIAKDRFFQATRFCKWKSGLLTDACFLSFETFTNPVVEKKHRDF